MPNNGAYNNQAANAGERNVGPVGLTRLPVAGSMPAGVIFQDGFDDQPDWTSAMHSTDRVQIAGTHTIPEGWYAVRQDPYWSESAGYPGGREVIEILAANSAKARGGSGKSFVAYRDHTQTPDYWASDSILAKYFAEGFDEIYAEFYVRFQEGWTPEGGGKLFRVSSWSGSPDIFGYGNDRENGPTFFLDYKESTGIRNYLAFRGGVHGVSYGMNNNMIDDIPRDLVYIGDYPGNWTSNTVGSTYGADPQIPDKLNGGFISKDIGYYPTHEQIYGPAGTWSKYGFYLKMNSAPGVMDGKFKEWFDDRLVLETDKVMWVPASHTGEMPKWNVVALGGNWDWDTGTYTDADRRQEWYAIDDVVIRDSIPENLP